MSQEVNVKVTTTGVSCLENDTDVYIQLTHVDLATILSVMGDVQRGLTKLNLCRCCVVVGTSVVFCVPFQTLRGLFA